MQTSWPQPDQWVLSLKASLHEACDLPRHQKAERSSAIEIIDQISLGKIEVKDALSVPENRCLASASIVATRPGLEAHHAR
jgi:hypothetical protein